MNQKMVELRDLLEEFVDENFSADGCRECHEQGHPIMPDVMGSQEYEKNITDFFNKVYEVFER